jgi:hypothetical protein
VPHTYVFLLYTSLSQSHIITMKSFQILALLTVGSCALVSADTGLLRASSEVEAAPADNVVEEFALLDQNEKNRVLNVYSEGTEGDDEGYGSEEKDDVDMDSYGMGKGKFCLGYYHRWLSQSPWNHLTHALLSHTGGKGMGKGGKGMGKGGKGK